VARVGEVAHNSFAVLEMCVAVPVGIPVANGMGGGRRSDPARTRTHRLEEAPMFRKLLLPAAALALTATVATAQTPTQTPAPAKHATPATPSANAAKGQAEKTTNTAKSETKKTEHTMKHETKKADSAAKKSATAATKPSK
jgi:hypothetical protein